MSNYPNKASLLNKISGYKGILSLDPSSTAFVPLSEAYRKMGMLADAEEVAARGVRALPTFCPGYAALGRVQAQRGTLDAAVASFEKALAIDGQSIDALKGLARVRMLRGEKELASDLLKRALALDPADAAARKMLSSLVPPSAGPRPDTRASGSASKEGADPISTVTIAEIYIRQGFLKRALKVYQDLSEADPGNETIGRKLAELQERIDSAEAEDEEGELQPEGSLERQLAIMGRWLDSIARRRSRVS